MAVIETKVLPGLNRDGKVDPTSTVHRVRIVRFENDAGIPYRYSNRFLRLCENCPACENNMCDSRIKNIEDYRYYRILDVDGKFRYIPKSARPKRGILPPIFSVESAFNNAATDDFDAGHLVAAFMGGLDCPFNLALMNSYHNRHGSYSLMELHCRAHFSGLDKAEKGYCTGMIRVKLTYNEEFSLVPSHFGVRIDLHRMAAVPGGKVKSSNDSLSSTFPNSGRKPQITKAKKDQLKAERAAIRKGNK